MSNDRIKDDHINILLNDIVSSVSMVVDNIEAACSAIDGCTEQLKRIADALEKNKTE